MLFPAWGRLATYYERNLTALFGDRLWEFVQHPELVKDPAIQRAIRDVATRVSQKVAIENARSWREAAAKWGRGRQIYQALQAEIDAGHLRMDLELLIRRNTELISSVPADIAERITAAASTLQQEGARAGEIEKELRRRAPGLAKSRMRLIARTEISGAETDLTQVRAQRLGLEWYQWATSEDSRVRPSHRKMDKVLCAWNDPPAPEALAGIRSTLGKYAPGRCPNCRCIALALADLAEIRWPAQVHRGGRLARMTRAQFSRIVGLPMAA
jgi:SPP1 gp7 family putative phage head morphogenesis protein